MGIKKIVVFSGLYFLSFNLLANNQCYDKVTDLNDTHATSVISVVFEYPKERGMLNANALSGLTPIYSAEDKKIIPRLSERWLNAGSHQSISDSFFSPLSDQVESQSKAEMQQEKDRFLDHLSKLGRKDASSKVFIYSGHGVQCYDAKTKAIQWCLALPMRNEITSKALRPIIDDPNVSEPIFDKDEEFLVTEEQVLQATQAKLLILDSCHSDQASQHIQTKKIDKGLVVISSSLTPFASFSEKNKGGKLLQMLDAMTNVANTPQVCAMDLNGDGQVSIRENLLTMQLGLLKKDRKVNFQNVEQFISAGMENSQDNNLSVKYMYKNQMFSGIVDETCFAKIPQNFNCETSSLNNPENNKCENLNNNRKFLNNKISALLKNDEFFNQIGTTLVPLASGKAIGGRPAKTYSPARFSSLIQPKQPAASYAYDKRMQDASSYLSDWEQELAQEENMCSLNDADTCNARSDRGRLFKSIKDLLAIGLR